MEFFWYDYETWGKNPHRDRIVQFGGVRTDENLELIGDEIELKCKPQLDCPIGPGAVNVHGILPMDAHKYGFAEGEFAKRIHDELSRAGTCSVAYNGMSFDHELTRVLFYRNLRDPYRWSWDNGNSSWDTIDLVRAAFLLFPEALKHWPKRENGRVSFKLEDLSIANLEPGEILDHHSAIGDSIYTWKLSKRIHQGARPLWDHALSLRKKENVKSIMDSGETILHVVWRIPTDRSCSTLLSSLGALGQYEKEIHAFDLFYDPTPLLKPYSQWTQDDKSLAARALLSVKINKSPFVARWSELTHLLSTDLSQSKILERMHLKESQVQERHAVLNEYRTSNSSNPFVQYIQSKEVHKKNQFSSFQADPDEAIYDGFISDPDRKLMNEVLRQGAEFNLESVQSDDSRVEPLIFRYLARNFPEIRDGYGKERWLAYCRSRQLEHIEKREVNADQIFSYELRDSSVPWGKLDELKVQNLVKWQNRVRELLMP